MDDPFNLERFVQAQDKIYPAVIAELQGGRKRSHWMWFIFPQLAGLGSSSIARFFAIAALDEARAYHAHPVLGARLKECTLLVMAIEHRPLDEILGPPDDLKFRSSMTLFSRAAPHDPLFSAALDKYCGGEPDPKTLQLLT
jgi:uncharacterized protein (DUF1810 family)